ncbi:minor tail protein [Gordonia phage Upyo]|nr:minor tail protein [Gordonia phage Upyo]
MARGRNIRYISPDGEVWPLHGENMGDKGIYLTSLSGFYHPNRVPITLTPAYKRGAIPGTPKTDASRIGLKIFTTADDPAEWERVESRWWNAWSDEADGRLEVESLSGGSYRWQPIRLEKYPDDPFDFEPDTDMDWTMPCISYSPGWRGNLLKSSATGTGNTTIRMANPGDMDIWPHFTGDPVPGLKIPDGIGGDLIDIKSAQFDPDNGEWLIITDQEEVTIEDVQNSQVVALLAGLMFKTPIPAGTTTPVDVPIVLGSTSNTVRAYMEPLYKRPWG